jgi:putative membrane protein
MGLIGRTLINAIAIAIAAALIPGISYGHPVPAYGFGAADQWLSLGLTAFVFGIVNAFVRPIIELISMPITCLTLGLFHFVVAGLMLLLVSAIPILGFRVDNIITAIIGALVIGIVGFVVARIIPH